MIPNPPTYSTPNSAPITITVDSYTLPDADAFSSHYVIDFEGENGLGIGAIRDVVSIELIYATVPVFDGEIYTILKLNDYSRVRSNNKFARNSFCIIPNQNPALDDYYSIRRVGSLPDDNMIYYFPEPTKLNKLDIEFVSPSGTKVWFTPTGEDPADVVDPVPVRYVLTLEIRTLNRAPKPDARFINHVKGPW